MSNECSWYDPSCALQWLADEFKAFFIWAYDGILSGLAALFELIPVPDFLMNVPSYQIPASIAWALSAFNVPFGIGLVVSAYTARFILRRIPAIG